MAIPNTTPTKVVVLAPDGWKRTGFPDGSLPGDLPPSAPPEFTTSASSFSITATVTAANGATRYRVRVDSGAAESGLTKTGLSADTLYSFQVQGVNDFGESDWSTSVNVTTDVASTSWRANEPSGFTSAEERDFDTLEEDGWWHNGVTITADSTSNHGTTGNVGRFVYPAGFAGGSAPGSTGINSAISSVWTTGVDEIYLCFEVRLSSNWQPHSTGTNKVFYITMEAQGGGGDPAFISVETGLTPDQVEVRNQGTGDNDPPTDVLISEQEFLFGQWHLVEVHLIRNTLGVSDGELHLWVDGVKTQRDTSCQWHDTSGAAWNTVKWEPIWGGVGGTVSEEMYQDISRIHVGVK